MALVEAGVDDPEPVVVVPADLDPAVDAATVAFSANVPPIAADPSPITQADAPATFRYLAEQCPDRDWILGRILWLCGEEPGLNRGGDRDSQRRFIYIHGTPPTEPIGIAASHGCIRLYPDVMMTVFDRTPIGCPVWIR